MFHLTIPSFCSILLFHPTVPSYCSIWLFHPNVRPLCFIVLFLPTVPSECFIWLLHPTVPFYFSILLFHPTVPVWTRYLYLENIWIYTRERIPEAYVLNRAYRTLARLNLQGYKLLRTDQVKCPIPERAEIREHVDPPMPRNSKIGPPSTGCTFNIVIFLITKLLSLWSIISKPFICLIFINFEKIIYKYFCQIVINIEIMLLIISYCIFLNPY